MGIFRNTTHVLGNAIQDVLASGNIQYARVEVEYPETLLSVPTAAISFNFGRSVPCELGKHRQYELYYYIDIFSLSRGQRDDMASLISNKLMGTAHSYDNMFFDVLSVETIEPELRSIPSLFHTDYYYYVNLYSGGSYGMTPYREVWDSNNITIDIDFELNNLQALSGFQQNTIVPAVDHDITICKTYGVPNYSIIDGLETISSLNINQGIVGQPDEYRPYFALNTEGLLDIDGLKNIILYFYAVPTVYTYRGDLYAVDTDTPFLNATGIWNSTTELVSSLSFVPTGWHQISIPTGYINNDGYTVFSLQHTGEDPRYPLHIKSFESDLTYYLQYDYGNPVYYKTSYLVSRYDDDEKSGYGLYVKDGDLYWEVGFNITTIFNTFENIETGVRYHVIGSFGFQGGRYQSNLWVNNDLKDLTDTILGQPPRKNETPYVIGATTDPDYTSFVDAKIYGSRFRKSFIDEPNTKDGESLNFSREDLGNWPINEGFGTSLYDVVDTNIINLSGDNYAWGNYLTTTTKVNNFRQTTLVVKIKVNRHGA